MTDIRIVTIADHYGFDNQLRKLTEEMAELTVAIHHFLDRNDDESKPHSAKNLLTLKL